MLLPKPFQQPHSCDHCPVAQPSFASQGKRSVNFASLPHGKFAFIREVFLDTIVLVSTQIDKPY